MISKEQLWRLTIGAYCNTLPNGKTEAVTTLSVSNVYTAAEGYARFLQQHFFRMEGIGFVALYSPDTGKCELNLSKPAATGLIVESIDGVKG